MRNANRIFVLHAFVLCVMSPWIVAIVFLYLGGPISDSHYRMPLYQSIFVAPIGVVWLGFYTFPYSIFSYGLLRFAIGSERFCRKTKVMLIGVVVLVEMSFAIIAFRDQFDRIYIAVLCVGFLTFFVLKRIWLIDSSRNECLSSRQVDEK